MEEKFILLQCTMLAFDQAVGSMTCTQKPQLHRVLQNFHLVDTFTFVHPKLVVILPSFPIAFLNVQ